MVNESAELNGVGLPLVDVSYGKRSFQGVIAIHSEIAQAAVTK